MKIQYDFFLSFERLGRMHETKKTFFFTKTRYFNIGFVFLQYIKNEPILIKMDRKICEKIMDVFENVFFFFVNF
jgi:hypothetical protein